MSEHNVLENMNSLLSICNIFPGSTRSKALDKPNDTRILIPTPLNSPFMDSVTPSNVDEAL